jgi:NAD(P)H-hydrate epimerase
MKLKIMKHKKTSHKGDNGKVLLVGGSEDFIGAVAMVGLAALRSGCDLVVIAAPEKTAWAINCLSPDLITKKFSGKYFSLKHANEILRFIKAKKFDAVVMGNGIGKRKETMAFVRKIVRNVDGPLIIDADAIKAVRLQDLANSIVTPHEMEFKVLLKNSKIKIKKLNQIQKHLKSNVIILKGYEDKIVSKTKIRSNKTGNERMSVAGTGDVLAGLTAGFVSQGYPLFTAAEYSSYINGKLGDKLKKKKGYSYIASDLVEDLKKIKLRLRRQKRR